MAFDAKVDLWFLAAFYGFGALMVGLGPRTFRDRSKVVGVLLVGLGVAFVGVGWRVSAVELVLSDDGYLDSRGWPFDSRLAPIAAIRRIEPSRDPRGSHAASLDRLRIDYGEDGLVFIAVEDKSAFLDAIAARDPALVRTATGVVRESGARESAASR